MANFKSFKPSCLQIFLAVFCFVSFSALTANAQKPEQIDLKNCIQMFIDDSFIIKDRATFLKTIRNDASRENCLKNLQEIDFEKNTLIGIDLSTGYCGVPLFLATHLTVDKTEKRYILKITYVEPVEPCRALSSYDLWLLVPKMPENYTVKFDVKGEKSIVEKP